MRIASQIFLKGEHEDKHRKDIDSGDRRHRGKI